MSRYKSHLSGSFLILWNSVWKFIGLNQGTFHGWLGLDQEQHKRTGRQFFQFILLKQMGTSIYAQQCHEIYNTNRITWRINSCYTFYVALQRFRNRYCSVLNRWSVPCFFSRVLHWFRVCFRALRPSRVFQCLALLSYFTRALHWFHVFPRFTLVPYFSRILHWFHVFPRFT